MAGGRRVVVLGGHGRIALLLAPRLASTGYDVDSVVRDPEQRGDVEAVGATPVVLDIERASVDDLAELLRGAAAVVFSAGAGGGDPARTRAVDLEAAVRAMTAAEQAGVDRFVTVSYAAASHGLERVDPDSSFFPYAEAKHEADAHLRGTGLDFTILGPGMLTFEPASGRIRIADPDGSIDGRRPAAGEAVTSRDNVAAVIAHVVSTGAGSRRTIDFYDGDTPIADAIA